MREGAAAVTLSPGTPCSRDLPTSKKPLDRDREHPLSVLAVGSAGAPSACSSAFPVVPGSGLQASVLCALLHSEVSSLTTGTTRAGGMRGEGSLHRGGGHWLEVQGSPGETPGGRGRWRVPGAAHSWPPSGSTRICLVTPAPMRGLTGAHGQVSLAFCLATVGGEGTRHVWTVTSGFMSWARGVRGGKGSGIGFTPRALSQGVARQQIPCHVASVASPWGVSQDCPGAVALPEPSLHSGWCSRRMDLGGHFWDTGQLARQTGRDRERSPGVAPSHAMPACWASPSRAAPHLE